jgi:hypothetical protein
MSGGGEGAGCGVSANEHNCAHETQINFGDLTPYLTYEILGQVISHIHNYTPTTTPPSSFHQVKHIQSQLMIRDPLPWRLAFPLVLGGGGGGVGFSLICAGIFKQSMGARNRGLSYRLHRLAELIPWNRFLGSVKV